MEAESGAPASAGASGFEINGTRYEIPNIDTITLDEERILYVYADTVLQDFAFPHPEMESDAKLIYEARQSAKVRNPDFKRALAHIAYKRAHPEVKDSEIQIAIGGANALEVDIALLRGDAEGPPAMTSQKQPESKSDTSELLKSTDSGSPTANTSAQVVSLREPIGTTESAMSSPGAARIESVS